MIRNQTLDLDFPTRFWALTAKSVASYKNFFLSYLFLAVVAYVPFFIIGSFSGPEMQDIFEFFHGGFLDIIIFLTLPTIRQQNQVYPFATIQLFFQRFFASAVIIILVQLGVLLYFARSFAAVSISAIIIGLVPYVFLLFAGFYLIMENSRKMISIKSNMISSIKIVKKQFFTIFWSYINITIICILPLFLFTIYYLGNHPEITAFAETLDATSRQSDVQSGQKLLEILQLIAGENGFKWSRITIHIVLRPIKSLFLSFLFLGALYRTSPDLVNSFLGIAATVPPGSEIDEA